MRIGVIGYGYWGPNIVRNFHSQENCEVVLVADRNAKCEGRLKKMFPSVAFTTDENAILTSPNIDIVAVVTPVWTHYELANVPWRMASTCSSRSLLPTAPLRRKN